ncbi:MAG: hypothetical protein IT371_10140 [Deltaproteobacteria bacterium]|nr:hypothetical protein [Deltaproteobacteria bacterium]
MELTEDTPLAEFVSRYPVPLRLWMAPAARDAVGSSLAQDLGLGAELHAVPSDLDDSLRGPAVLLLTPQDFGGPHRMRLLRLLEMARPGRPVVYGGNRDKDVLLEAINTWRVFRLVPDRAPISFVADAIRKAYQAEQTDYALACAVEEYRGETRRLQSALTQLKQTQDRLLQAERLSTIGRITGTLMGRLGGSLAQLSHVERLAAAQPADPDLSTLMGHATDGVHALEVMLGDLLAFAEGRPESFAPVAVDVDQLVARTVELARFDPLARERKVEVHLGGAGSLPLDRYRIVQVLLNLLRNAFQATRPGDRVAIRTARQDRTVEIAVEDAGCGMTDEVRQKLFTPFFTTRAGDGLGLGLKVSKATVERHGGSMECESAPGRGTCFRIRLPLVT